MALTANTATRAFSFNGVDLQDPAPNMSPDEVRELYSATFPELTTATIEGPEVRNNRLIYTFKRAVGTKG